MVKALVVARTGDVVVTRHEVGVVTGDVVTSSMVAWCQTDVVTAVKTAEAVMGTVSIRNSRTPALMLYVGTLCLLPQCEVRANCITRFIISLFWWRYVCHMMRNWSLI